MAFADIPNGDNGNRIVRVSKDINTRSVNHTPWVVAHVIGRYYLGAITYKSA